MDDRLIAAARQADPVIGTIYTALRSQAQQPDGIARLAPTHPPHPVEIADQAHHAHHRCGLDRLDAAIGQAGFVI